MTRKEQFSEIFEKEFFMGTNTNAYNLGPIRMAKQSSQVVGIATCGIDKTNTLLFFAHLFATSLIALENSTPDIHSLTLNPSFITNYSDSVCSDLILTNKNVSKATYGVSVRLTTSGTVFYIIEIELSNGLLGLTRIRSF